jgi:tRNA-binding protein
MILGSKSGGSMHLSHSSADLVSRQIAAVVNFAPRQTGKFMSEVLTLGFANDKDEVVLFSPDRVVPNGPNS